MRERCQSCSPQNSYISGTATKHKDVNTLKVNSWTNHFYCFAHLWQWLDVSVHAKLSVKMWNVTFEATYHTTVWSKFITFIRDSFVDTHESVPPPPLDLMRDCFSSFFWYANQLQNCPQHLKIKSIFYIVLHPQLWGLKHSFSSW